MAQKVVTITTLIDDLSGELIEDGKGESIKFSLDGSSYEIDLSSTNAKSLRDSLKPYIKSARPAAARRSTTGTRNSKEDLAATRTWLRANGHEVNDRGRISTELLDLYKANR